MHPLPYFTLLTLILLASCKHAPPVVDPVPRHDTFTIAYAQVGETRTINVWMPEAYRSGTAGALPVLYMLDGGVQEDFPHIANTLADLVTANKIRPVMLVGIENTQRRRDLTGPTNVAKDKEIAPVVGGSAQFRSFVQNELFAEVNKRYRTTSEKGIIGESLAGLFVTETLLLAPDMFDFYIAFDPSLWWNDQYLVKTAREYLIKLPSKPKKFWFASSGAEDIYKATGPLSETLKAGNMSNLTWEYVAAPNEQHSTIFRATKERALIWALH